ncbi:MAG: hypothetical protein JNJ77_04675 [Planctomycetia bacterium]|nr:hypothetical protein [Planctomycetia bacterium]
MGSHPLNDLLTSDTGWDTAAVALAWEGYSEALLRKVASEAIKPRQKLPLVELRQKLIAWPQNPPQVDRRLRELSESARTLLSLLHLGKRHTWRMGTLLELVSCLKDDGAQATSDGLKVVEELFLQGMVIAAPSAERSRISSFEEWLGQGEKHQFRILIDPEILSRAAGYWKSLPELSTLSTTPPGTPREADGLDWFLRLGAAWQSLHDAPARLTQQGAFFKRDHDRLMEDALLNQSVADLAVTLPQQGHAVVALGLGLGLLELDDLQVKRSRYPVSWLQGWKPALTHMVSVWSELHSWSVTDGWCGVSAGAHPWSSAFIVVLGLLQRLEPGQWTTPADLAAWLVKHHCYWSPLEHPPELADAVQTLLLGILYPLRLVQSCELEPGKHAVRLSQAGRAVLSTKEPLAVQEFPKTLLIQPNMEMVAYRQGLNPKMIALLSQAATWKTQGTACMLTLDQHSVHRGMEVGDSFESISSLLDQHSVHPPPGNVVEALRTWAAKRDRLTVYQGVNLLEFLTKADLDEALARGFQGVVLADRYLLIEQEDDLDYRHFRTLGTRDYTLPPTQCVNVAEDGVTLTVDPARADLLLETELLRFTQPSVVNDQRLYRITYQTLDQARTQGLSLRFLSDWFGQRTGQPLPHSARLLWSDRSTNQVPLEQVLILRTESEQQADGMMQWPEIRNLILERLGPSVLLVHASQVNALRMKLAEIGLHLNDSLEGNKEPSRS